jgi:hypothetical protein
VDLQWELGVAEIEQLLELAASGSRVGLRNAPLKLLRVYLSEIGGGLAAVDRPSAGAAFLTLRDQLRLASCLKPRAPIPGRVELTLEVSKDGTMRLGEPGVIDCLTALRRAEGDEVARLKQVLAVRRHLGWEIGLEVRPDPQVTVGAVFRGLQPYFDSGLELAGPPRALVPGQGTNMPTAVVFRPAFIPAGLLVRLRHENNGITTAVARKAIVGSGSSMAALFKADEVAGAAFNPVADLGRTVQELEPAMQSLVMADASLTWSELLEAVGPLLERRVPFDVCVGS